MSSFGSQMRKRLNALRKAGENVPQIMAEVLEGATVQAVKTTIENTPPNGSAIAGTNTRSGDLAQHWATDSETKPVKIGSTFQTKLANNMLYASYVNDGHRVDKHYVPGLIRNGGLLEMVDPSQGGIMVGTKTTFVKGIYMKEKGIGRFKTAVRTELDRRVKEAFK